jgi:hypothetical protein
MTDRIIYIFFIGLSIENIFLVMYFLKYNQELFDLKMEIKELKRNRGLFK